VLEACAGEESGGGEDQRQEGEAECEGRGVAVLEEGTGGVGDGGPRVGVGNQDKAERQGRGGLGGVDEIVEREPGEEPG
jgi:hypothetical protein